MVWSVFILVLIGVWHGANWTFLMFGLVNGVILVIQRTIRFLPLMRAIRSNKITLNLQKYFNLNLLLLEAIYFRSLDVEMAHKIYYKIFTEFNLSIFETLSLYKFEFLTSVFVSCLLWITALFKPDLKFKYNWAYVVGIIAIIIFLGQDMKNQFVYFQI